MASAIENFYSGPMLFERTNNIYVHFHARNIGKAAGGSAISADQAIQNFRDRKKQAIEASKTQYKTLFKNSLSEDSYELLEEVFNNDDLMTKVSQEMGKKFEEALSFDKMQKLMQLQRSEITTNNFAEEILKNSKESISNFNILLKALSEAANLLETDAGGALAAVLSSKYEGEADSKKMGSFLLSALEDFKKDNNEKPISSLQIQQIDQIISSINALGRALQSGKTSSENKDITGSAIRRMVESIFNTGFAESISAILTKTAYVGIGQVIASLSGSQQVEILQSDEFGHLTKTKKGTAAYGKADALFENVKINLEGYNSKITLTVGISDKFYKSNQFPGLKGNEGKQSYSSGYGGNLIQTLSAAFGNNLRYRYLAYNTLAHGRYQNWSIAQQALNEVLLARQIVRLFASRGGNKDFAQFMYVNGQIVPIWNIILSTLNDISLSKSLGGDESQPVTLSIEGRDKIQTQARTRRDSNADRIARTNAAVAKAKITAHLNLKNLTK